MQREVIRGHDLTAAEAEATEQQLAANEWNMEARARLVGYYFSQVQKGRHETPDAVREARGRHISWLIRNDPASEVLGMGDAFAMSGWMEDSGNYNAMRALWLAAVERAPDNLQVLLNASKLLQQRNRPTAVKLMRRSYELTSHNDWRVTNYFGMQLGLLWTGSGNDGTVASENVAAELEASRDAQLVGAAGSTIARLASPGGPEAAYADTLLRRAIALAPNDRYAAAWQEWLRKLDDGTANPQLDVMESVLLARRTHGTDPVRAPLQGASGVVSVRAEVGRDGAVKGAMAVAGPKELWSAAANAVKEWRFIPMLVNGNPVAVSTVFSVAVNPPSPER